MSEARYALYFCPIEHEALWDFGSSVIGYDSHTQEDVSFLLPDGIGTENWRALTEEPRRYGFHATLKAPFRLKKGRSEQELRAQAAAFAQEKSPLALGPLQVKALGSFIALVPEEASAALPVFVQSIVEACEPFRAPLTDEETARRLQSPLNPRQKELLAAFGYPYVAEQFRFHMTLSGSIADEAAREAVRASLSRLHAEKAGDAPVVLSSLALLKQPSPDSRFHILDHFPFTA